MSEASAATHVLIVDDQAIIGEAVRRMLAPHPEYKLQVCTQGATALDTVVKAQPDVILQDLVMPDADGLDLVSAYRKEPQLQRTPLIVLSSKEEATTKAEAFARGANDYLVKLPDAVELVARIKYHAAAHRARKERDAAFDALQAELNSAARYVQSLIPPPMEGDVTTHWRFVPTASLGGDSFGYHWLAPRKLALYLLDVSGHGVGPALLSVSVMNALRTDSVDADPADPGKVLAALNNAFPMSDHNGMFFTMWYGVADLDARTLRYACAGHPPALLVPTNGDACTLGGDESAGPMIGAVPDLEFVTCAKNFDAGTKLYLYSDGIFELSLPDGTMWSMEEFLKFAQQEARKPGDALARFVTHAQGLRQTKEFEDDVSLLEVVFS